MSPQWANVLGSFVSETGAVTTIAWSEWAAPAGLDEHRQWLTDHQAEHPLDNVRHAYEQLLAHAGTTLTHHEVLVTVTLDAGRLRRNADGATHTAATKALLGEMRLFTQRLEAAGLTVSAPLTPNELARAIRIRLDPHCRQRLDATHAALGDQPAASFEPPVLAAHSAWSSWRADDATHRSFHVSDWPRLDVSATWMSSVLIYTGAVRCVTVIYEPIPRSRSQRNIIRAAAKIESDTTQRAEKGFRVGAHHRRARQAIEEREEELVAGYPELGYCGIVTVTALRSDDLNQVADEIVQVAAGCGMELRPLHGRHDAGLVATLPVARTLKPKRQW
jgi:hypothetical protein